MAIVFLIGGTGNQLFSFAASSPKDTFSRIFLGQWVRRTLKWTLHEQVIQYPRPKVLKHGFALLALFVDLTLTSTIGKSLFTSLDTRKLKAQPLLFEIARLGYFQQALERRNVAELAGQFAPITKAGQIVLHVRGGDLLMLERAGYNVYGILDERYYQAGITAAMADFADRGQPVTQILVLTDDPAYAATLNLNAKGVPSPEIRNSPLSETLSLAIGADWFVSSNSTMSYWIVRMRKGLRSAAPRPFQRRRDYSLSDDCVRIPMDAEA